MGSGTDRVLVWISRLGHGYWTQPPPVFDPAPLPHLTGPARPLDTDPDDGPDPAAEQRPVHVGTWGDEDPFDHVQTYVQARERMKSRKTSKARKEHQNDDVPPF